MDDFIKLGTKNTSHYHGTGDKVALTVNDRRKHLLISGRSGMGKSTLLANLFLQEANSGRGCLLLDPHGDLAEKCLDLIPPRRIRKTIYLNPSDTAWPIAFNVLEDVAPDQRGVYAADIVAAFKSIFGDSWGTRLEYILYNIIAALLEVGGATLLSIPRMLLNKQYRETVTKQLRDPVIAQFWRDEFPQLEKKFGMEAFSPVLNKIGQVLSSPAVRNIIAQPKSAFSPRWIMDNNYLLVVNLSQLGEQHANLLGSLLIASFGAAAMSRADIPETARKDFAMIIDEFPKFATTKFAQLLSEARKFRLSLTLSHQYLTQMPPEIRDAVFGNVGSLITFRISAQDAAIFSRELEPFPPEELTDTPIGEAYCRILYDGRPSEPFLLVTPKPPKPHGNKETIIRNSRVHWATAREKVETSIQRFLSNEAKRCHPNGLQYPPME